MPASTVSAAHDDGDDMAFVARLIAREEAAWHEFLHRYRYGLRAVAVQYQCVHEFDDIFGSFLVKLLGGMAQPGILRQFDGRARLSTFLSISFRHHLIDQCKMARPCEALTEEPEDAPASDPAVAVAIKEEETLLLEALGRLDAQERRLIDLHFYQGHSVRMIADMLGCSKSSVARHVERVVRRVRDMLDGDGTISAQRSIYS